jgi:hypothetical protein
VYTSALQKYLVSAALDSTDKATCQSSNIFGYSSGSARDSAAFGLTYKTTQTRTIRLMLCVDKTISTDLLLKFNLRKKTFL